MNLFKLDGSGVMCVVIERTTTKLSVRTGLFGGELTDKSATTYDDEAAAKAAEEALVRDYGKEGYARGRTPEPHAANFYANAFFELLVRQYGVKRTESTTALNPDNTRATGTRSQPAANQYRSVGTLTFDNTAAVTEHGLFSQAATGGGTLWDRSVFSAINVVSGDSIQFTYTVTVSAGG